MRSRKPILLIVIFLSSLLWGVWSTLQSLPKWVSRSDSSLQERIAASNSSIVYILKPSHWLEFKLPTGADNVRLISNASIAVTLPTEQTDSWQYALDYQLLDNNGQLLLEDIYHKRTSHNKIEDSVTGELFAPNFYLSDELAPLDGQSILLNLSNFPDVDRLRVRLADPDPAINDVVVRVYYHEKIPKRKLSLIWKRMSDKRKETLASGNIYSFDLLTDQEKRRLLSELQRPLSPVGIEGYTYQSRLLYSMQGYEGQRVYEPISLHGVLIDDHSRGVIPIPEKGGKIRLQFDQAYDVKANHTEEPIIIRWFGRKITDRLTYTIIWDGTTTYFEQFFDGGLLEISSQAQIVARAFLDDADPPLELTPENLYIRGYTTDKNVSVNYRVAHTNEDATPFRVDFRYIIPSVVDGQANFFSTIKYVLFDDKNNIIKQDNIDLFAEASAYDRIAGDMTGSMLSDPVTRYFSLPTNVTRVEFKSNNSVLVFAYNRPAGLTHEIKVPENTYVSVLDEWNQPAWFPMRPVDYENLILRNQSILVTIQPRPPEDKPDLLAGRYRWEDYHPEGSWSARYILTPIDEVESIREEAYSSVYRPITLGKDSLFVFHAPLGVRNIMPNLAYFRQEDTPFDITVFMDNEPFFYHRVTGRQGEIQLPNLMAGRRNIKVVASTPAKIMLSHTQPAADGFLKRAVNRFDQNKLNFVYDRENLEEETLSIRLYVPYGTETRSKVRVQIENIDPLPLIPLNSWSFDTRRFDVRPGTTPISVMGVSGEQVDHGYPFFVALGEDLPIGRYQIKVSLESGKGSYLSLSKFTPGDFQTREILHETEVSLVKVIK